MSIDGYNEVIYQHEPELTFLHYELLEANLMRLTGEITERVWQEKRHYLTQEYIDVVNLARARSEYLQET